MSKLIYLANRNPGLSRERFVARWRKHGALAMSLPLWRRLARYVQASVLHPAPIPGASTAYDAVGVLWYKDDAGRSSSAADDADIATMAADEVHTFAALVRPGALQGDEEVLKQSGSGRTTAYLFFNDEAKARRVAEGAAGSAASHRVALTLAWPLTEPGLPYRAVVDVSAEDVPGVKSALGVGGLDAAGADVAMVARDAVLWENLDGMFWEPT
jgi:hypothetical protein